MCPYFQNLQCMLGEVLGAGAEIRAASETHLCEGRGRIAGTLKICIWLTLAAVLAAGWPHCRPFDTRQRRCDMFSASSGPVGSSPQSVSPSLSSATQTEHPA